MGGGAPHNVGGRDASQGHKGVGAHAQGRVFTPFTIPSTIRAPGPIPEGPSTLWVVNISATPNGSPNPAEVVSRRPLQGGTHFGVSSAVPYRFLKNCVPPAVRPSCGPAQKQLKDPLPPSTFPHSPPYDPSPPSPLSALPPRPLASHLSRPSPLTLPSRAHKNRHRNEVPGC